MWAEEFSGLPATRRRNKKQEGFHSQFRKLKSDRLKRQAENHEPNGARRNITNGSAGEYQKVVQRPPGNEIHDQVDLLGPRTSLSTVPNIWTGLKTP